MVLIIYALFTSPLSPLSPNPTLTLSIAYLVDFVGHTLKCISERSASTDDKDKAQTVYAESGGAITPLSLTLIHSHIHPLTLTHPLSHHPLALND